MKYLEFSQVVGQPSGGVWSQVVVWPAAEAGVDNRIQIRGTGVVGVVVLVRRESDDEAQEVGHGLIAEIEVVLNEGGDLISQVKGVVTGKEEVEVLLVRVGEKMVEMVGKGEGRVMIDRGGRVGRVYQGVKNEWRARKGAWRAGDRMLVGTEGLLGEMSKMLMEDVLRASLQDAGDELVTRVQAAEDNASAAGLIVELGEEEEKVSKVVEVGVEEEVEKQEKMIDPEPAVYLKQDWRRRKMAVGAGVVILVLLLVSVGIGFYQRERMAVAATYEQVEQEVTTKISQAEVLAEDNPAKAKELVVEGQQAVEVAAGGIGENAEYQERLNGLRQALDDAYRQVSGEVALGEAPVWFDLNLVKEGMFGSRMAVDGSRVVVLDEQQSLLASIGVSNKQAELVGGGELVRGASLVDVLGRRGVVLADAGIVEVDMENKTSAELVGREDDWQRIVGLALFGGNVYVADAGAGEIWRYPGLSSGVGERQRWFRAGVEPDLSGMRDMVIDGDVWTVDEGGEVDRYQQGVELNYIIEGLEVGMGDVVAVDTSADSEYVYVLDRLNKRVVVLNKETAAYERQVLWEGLAAATDMVVVEEEGKILVLSGQTIYELPLGS